MTGAVVPITEIRKYRQAFVVRNIETDEADQDVLPYIEGSEVVLSVGCFYLIPHGCYHHLFVCP